MVWLLDDVYDTKHRAYMMREKEMVITSNLNILQICLKLKFTCPKICHYLFFAEA